MAALLLPKAELETLELSQKQFTASIIRAQKQMEAWHFGIRKHVFEYDSVINKQRQAIYKKRDEILFSESDEQRRDDVVKAMLADVPENIHDVLHNQLTIAQNLGQSSEAFLEILSKEMSLSFDEEMLQHFHQLSLRDLSEQLESFITDIVMNKLQSVEKHVLYQVMKDVYLYHLDTLRISHIDEMEYLRDKVGLMGYAQIDPLVVFKKEAFEKFQTLLWRLKSDVTNYLISFDFHQQVAQLQPQ